MNPHDIEPAKIKTVHLIAICGTGMGALAGILKSAGYQVTGSDENIYPPMSTQLESMGIEIMPGFSADHLSHKPDLVIIGNVIRRENPEARAAIDGGYAYLSFPGALAKFFLSKKRTIAICGTHGKTTTTSLVSHLFLEAGADPSFLIGGILQSIGAGFRVGKGQDFIIEGDEYDTAFFDKVPKFIRYQPRWAVVANIEFDHADIYSGMAPIREAFFQLVSSMPGNGLLFAGIDCPEVRRVITQAMAPVISFGIDKKADYHPGTWEISGRNMRFEVMERGHFLGAFSCDLAGEHNLKNLLAAVAICRAAGFTTEQIQRGLSTFTGVRRRQEVRGTAAGVTVIDDFAHHPTAVDVTLNSLRLSYPEQRLVAVFEPRTNTSRRSFFQARYAESFGAADEIFIAPVFGLDQIEPEQRFKPQQLVADLIDVGKQAAYAESYDDLLEMLDRSAKTGDVFVLMSNGGFGNLHQRLLERLNGRD